MTAFVAVATFIVRFGLSKHLEAMGVPVVGEAANADEATRALKSCRPDVLFLDSSLPGEPAADLVPRLGRVLPDLRIIALSDSCDADLVRELMHAGVEGFIPISAPAHEFRFAIDAVMEGHRWLSPPAVGPLWHELMNGNGSGILPRDFPLTGAQWDVAWRLDAGMSREGVKEELNIGESTFYCHRRDIFDRLKVGSVEGLKAWLREQACLPPQER